MKDFIGVQYAILDLRANHPEYFRIKLLTDIAYLAISAVIDPDITLTALDVITTLIKEAKTQEKFREIIRISEEANLYETTKDPLFRESR